MRDNEIRLSDSEKSLLREYRSENYGEQIPFGYVVKELIEETHD